MGAPESRSRPLRGDPGWRSQPCAPPCASVWMRQALHPAAPAQRAGAARPGAARLPGPQPGRLKKGADFNRREHLTRSRFQNDHRFAIGSRQVFLLTHLGLLGLLQNSRKPGARWLRERLFALLAARGGNPVRHAPPAPRLRRRGLALPALPRWVGPGRPGRSRLHRAVPARRAGCPRPSDRLRSAGSATALGCAR